MLTSLPSAHSGTVRIWHANTYRLEHTLDYGLDRVWYIACARGLNIIAMGYDEGSVMIKVCGIRVKARVVLPDIIILSHHVDYYGIKQYRNEET